MSHPLPLARAATRLRGAPGFPGHVGRPRNAAPSGDSVVTVGSGARMNSGPDGSAEARQASAQAPPAGGGVAGWPRLLTLPRAADYLGLGLDVTRELANTGALRAARVAIPAPLTAKRKGGRINLVLLDRVVLEEAGPGRRRVTLVKYRAGEERAT